MTLEFFFQIMVSATCSSLVQRIPTDCVGVTECNQKPYKLETSEGGGFLSKGIYGYI
jgi:hypothetical protein